MSNAERVRRRDLPHWDVPGAAYFVTSCLEGSIPARGLLDLEGYRKDLQRRPHPAGTSQVEWRLALWKLEFARTDRWLDREPAVRHLEDPALAAIFQKALLFFAGQRYDVFAFVVMPSHFHWVFQPREEWAVTLKGDLTPREHIVKSVNGYSSRQCNEHRGVSGTFWQGESYDHWVRVVEELERIIHYIEANPVKAGLAQAPEDWRFSSARLRRDQGLPFGVSVGADLPVCPRYDGHTGRPASP
jgi:type I restriction enzyme R subunit